MQQEFIRGLDSLAEHHRGNVATIGSFDGVHLGHQAILRQVTERAKALALPSVAMVFEPQPHEFFSREKAPARLTRLREKVKLLFSAGVDRVLCLHFNEALRALSAQAFVETVLVRGMGVRHLVVGDDFRFGCDRKGDYAMLKSAGESFGFSVCDTVTLQRHGKRVSSTRIRELLEEDNLTLAGELLGRPYSVAGRVIYGRQLGRTLKAPTANVGLGRYRSPIKGVYAVDVKVPADGTHLYHGVANVGVRPTLEGGKKPLLEVHLFDFERDIYGQCIDVVFRRKLRAEQKFDSLDQLQAQIADDIIQGRAYFAE